MGSEHVNGPLNSHSRIQQPSQTHLKYFSENSLNFNSDNYSFNSSMPCDENDKSEDYDDVSESDIIYYIQDILRSVGNVSKRNNR